jgi:hypothetical protein
MISSYDLGTHGNTRNNTNNTNTTNNPNNTTTNRIQSFSLIPNIIFDEQEQENEQITLINDINSDNSINTSNDEENMSINTHPMINNYRRNDNYENIFSITRSNRVRSINNNINSSLDIHNSNNSFILNYDQIYEANLLEECSHINNSSFFYQHLRSKEKEKNKCFELINITIHNLYNNKMLNSAIVDNTIFFKIVLNFLIVDKKQNDKVIDFIKCLPKLRKINKEFSKFDINNKKAFNFIFFIKIVLDLYQYYYLKYDTPIYLVKYIY